MRNYGIFNVEKVLPPNTALVFAVTNQDEARIGNRRHRSTNINTGTSVDEIKHLGGKAVTRVDETVRVDDLDGQTVATIKFVSIHYTDAEHLSDADCRAFGYPSRADYQTDGRFVNRPIWFIRFEHI